MKRTLFSVVLVGVGLAIGGFEIGDGIPTPSDAEWAARMKLFERAKIFRTDAAGLDPAASLLVDPNQHVINPQTTVCKYKPDEVTGTTPKYDCVLDNGDKVKVKYGFTKEIPSEIAASRLLHATGFAADRVSRVKNVRCYGCPFQPFHTRSLWQLLGLTGYTDKWLNYNRYRDFHDVSVERNFDGEAIEAGSERGWGFYELDKIDASKGGATRAEIDALRLMAVFLHHWDNKTANQRLTCPGASTPDCAHPVAMIQDVGSEFGPKKVDLDNWRSHPVWADATSCTVSMEWMPYDGGTFKTTKISEEGRALLAGRLGRIDGKHAEALFATAGFKHATDWAAVFTDRVRQIVDRAPCPSTTKLYASGSSLDRSSRPHD